MSYNTMSAIGKDGLERMRPAFEDYVLKKCKWHSDEHFAAIDAYDKLDEENALVRGFLDTRTLMLYPGMLPLSDDEDDDVYAFRRLFSGLPDFVDAHVRAALR